MSEPLRPPKLTVRDIAAQLAVPVSWVYAKVEADEIPHLKLGRYVRFEQDAIDAWLEDCRRGAGRAFTPIKAVR